MSLSKKKLIHVLRWSERYAKTDMVHFLKSNFWLNLNRILSIGNGGILSIAFAYLLTKEEYGTYAFALAFMGVFTTPPTTALGAGIMKGVARKDHTIIFEGLKRIFPWSIGTAIIVGVISLYYFFSGNITLGAILILSAVTLPTGVSLSVSKSFFALKGDFETPARFNLWRTPLMTSLLVIAALLTGSALWVVTTHILGNLILSWMLYREMRKKYSFSPATEGNREPFNSRYAFHSGIISIFGYFSEKLDQLLLWKLVGAAPVAIYSYAMAPVRELRSMIENQNTIAIPKFAQKEFSAIKANLSFRIKQMYIIAIPLTIIYILSAPLIFKFLFPQYIEAVALSQLAAVSLISAPRRLMNAAISAHQKMKETYIMVLFPNIVRIILASVLIPIYGITGAVLALIATEIIDYAVLGYLIKKST